MTTYAFDGAVPGRAKRADPQVIGEALETIRLENGGELHPQAVVADARDAKSPLHRYFEWDDKKAAEAHRMDQARALIRSVRVIDDKDEKSRPAFLSIRSDVGIGYHSIRDVLNSHDLRQRLLEQAQRDLDAWTARYRELREIVELVLPAQRELRRRVARPRGGDEARP
jgi:ADP-dependent phosphofructokinase/glucokinase